MLSASELKVVVATLTQRRAWLRKSLEDSNLEEDVRNENIATLKSLDSALQKLAASSSGAKPKVKPTTASAVKTIKDARILIAEDADDAAELLIDLMEDMGVGVADRAKDGMDAFDKIKRANEPYHIILCDWDMPELSGIEVFTKAKASNTLGGAHFIMVTGMTDAPHIKKAAQSGVNDYVAKPIDIDILEGKIKKALGLG